MFSALLDNLSAALIFFAVVFGPWAFGTTQTWSIDVMNATGFTLGVLWLAKLIIRQFTRDKSAPRTRPHFTTTLLVGASFLVLLYSFISAANARATYHPGQWQFEYHNAIVWLPHSYDADRSWDRFWQNLGLAGLFWALRDWLLTADFVGAGDQAWYTEPSAGGSIRLPSRLRRLLWVLAISGTLLAIQAIVQRLQGGDKVLWLVKPSVNGATVVEFGPFPYRGNASQYFNLLWPLILGLWWTDSTASPTGSPKKLNLLLAGVIFMAMCPLVATSRAGAAVLILTTGLAAATMWFASGAKRVKLAIPVVTGIMLLVGGLLGWGSLGPRLKHVSEDADGPGGRFELSRVGLEMAANNPLFGTGPGSLETMYQLYMHHWDDFWPAQLHNDWLEILATYGIVGFTLILICLGLAVSRSLFPGGIRTSAPFVQLLWIALAGCLIHAAFDWPMECHAVLTLFLVIGAILSCLSRQPPVT